MDRVCHHDGARHRDWLYSDRAPAAAVRFGGRFARRHRSSRGNSMTIDSKEASAALSDIDDMVARVRQSRIYDFSSRFMVVAGVFVTVGNVATYFAPRQ